MRLAIAAAIIASLTGASAMAAPAAGGGWAISGSPGKPVMSRTYASMTIRYKAVSKDEDEFTVSVAGCNGAQWSGEGGANPAGDTVKERAEDAALSIGSVINDAGGNCPGSANLEDSIMAGFGTAYAKFEAMKK